jgi:hypothetical protein
MVEKEELKQTAFRLPKRTLDILDRIIDEGKARNRTDALIVAVDASENCIFIDESPLAEIVEKQGQKIEELTKDIEKHEDMYTVLRFMLAQGSKENIESIIESCRKELQENHDSSSE